MARDDDWREQRRWDFDRDGRDAQRRAGLRTGHDQHDDDGSRLSYRAAREDAWHDERRQAARQGHADLRFSPFGATGPTAYGPYFGAPFAWGPGLDVYGYGAPFAGMMGAYGAARSDYAANPYGPNAQAVRPGEPRSFIDKAADRLATWFGDPDAEKRHREEDLQASHRGRGPKSYKRADSRILEDINDRLTEDPYLDATDVEVTVTSGEVTLVGMVMNREDKRRAERLAESVSGVRDVQNNLRLRRYDAVESGEKPSAGNF